MGGSVRDGWRRGGGRAHAGVCRPAALAATYLDPDNSVTSIDEALAGARDIIAEWINEDAGVVSLFLDRIGTTAVATSVDYQTTAGTATADVDAIKVTFEAFKRYNADGKLLVTVNRDHLGEFLLLPGGGILNGYVDGFLRPLFGQGAWLLGILLIVAGVLVERAPSVDYSWITVAIGGLIVFVGGQEDQREPAGLALDAADFLHAEFVAVEVEALVDVGDADHRVQVAHGDLRRVLRV